MTKQETFDRIVGFLRKQGRRSLSSVEGTTTTRCMYRALDGAQCAVGCLIPDADYRVEFEGNSVLRCQPLREIMEREGHHLGLLSDLQYAHDGGCFEFIETAFRRVACMHALTYSPPCCAATN